MFPVRRQPCSWWPTDPRGRRDAGEKSPGEEAGIAHICNTPGVTMARAHLCTNDCDHMWKKLKEKSIRTLEARF
jgi:hypothetical protein